MDDLLPALKSYNDIRKHFSREVFQQVMTYIAWHNRLTMTPIVTVPQTLALALLFDGREIDSLHFSSIRELLKETNEGNSTTAECVALATTLKEKLGLN